MKYMYIVIGAGEIFHGWIIHWKVTLNGVTPPPKPNIEIIKGNTSSHLLSGDMGSNDPHQRKWNNASYKVSSLLVLLKLLLLI